MLLKKIEQNGYTLKELAGKLKIDEQIFIKKINCHKEFNVREVVELSSLLHLTYREIEEIFFK